MAYVDDLREYEREHPGDAKGFAKKLFAERKPQKPDKLADYRDQRLNWPDGPCSIEPEVV